MASVDEALQLQAEREARILARRKRIQERMAALRQGDSSGKEQSGEVEELSGARKQVIESRRRLAAQRHKSYQEVSSVKLAADEREHQHREHEEQTKQALRAALLAEAEASARHNAEIAARWSELYDEEVPQELLQQIERQQQLCCRVIEAKQGLIKEVRNELRRKDEEFVRTQRRQAEEIDVLLGYMAKQYADMQAAGREELDHIQRAFLQERNELLGAQRKEMADLLAARARREADFLEGYLAAVEGYQRQLEEARVMDAEEFAVMKIRLESDITTLEQHLQTMLATYQLNQEKLEYNYRVLSERDHENQATISQQKRKVSRQRDALVGLKERAAKQDEQRAAANAKLTEEYRRVTEQFKELQVKCRHFQAADQRKFQQVWAMKQGEARQLLDELMQADRIITEQQLGWAWVPPDECVFASPHDVGAGHAAAGSTCRRPGSRNAAAGGSDEGQQAEDTLQEAVVSPGEAEVEVRLREPHYWGALEVLLDEAGFLLAGRAENMIARLPADDNGLVQARSILRALGITDGPAFDALMDALAADGDGGSSMSLSRASSQATGRAGSRAATHASGQESRQRLQQGASDDEGNSAKGEQQAVAGELQLVRPEDAVKRLRRFLEGGATAAGAAPGSRAGAAGASTLSGATGSVEPGNGTSAQMMGAARRAAEKEREYWARLGSVLSDEKYRVWCCLESRLQEYHSMLVARSQGLAQVEALAQQNAELEALLAQYSASGVNKTLIIPPTQLLG